MLKLTIEKQRDGRFLVKDPGLPGRFALIDYPKLEQLLIEVLDFGEISTTYRARQREEETQAVEAYLANGGKIHRPGDYSLDDLGL